MIFYNPYINMPYYNRYSRYGYYYPNYSKNNANPPNSKCSNSNKDYFDERKDLKDNNKKYVSNTYFKSEKTKDSSSDFSEDSPLFQIFGINLYFDDILLICLIFFLYQEGVKDEGLFIALILLLLS